MSTSTTEPTKPRVSEKMELLTGYDEIAIEKQFGKDIDSLRFTMTLRALVFIDELRAGKNPKDAHKSAMVLSLKDLGDCFGDEPDADDDDQGAEQDDAPAKSTPVE